jgi:hypothetical protein
MKRAPLKKRKSKRIFKNGSRINRMNLRPRPMRGGTRL